jgi:hypothetical protein
MPEWHFTLGLGSPLQAIIIFAQQVLFCAAHYHPLLFQLFFLSDLLYLPFANLCDPIHCVPWLLGEHGNLSILFDFFYYDEIF